MATERLVQKKFMDRLQRACRYYVDILDKGEPDIDIQKFLVLVTLSSSAEHQEYKNKLFKHWPTYFEDFEKIDSILNNRFPQSVCDALLFLDLDKDIRILDVACGPGNVARILRNHDYTNIDGLDAAPVLLEMAQKVKCYKNTYCCYVKADERTPIEDGTYDALLCSAGMFPGSILPSVQTFKELVRLVKKGGVLIWNIDDDYELYEEFQFYDKAIQQLIDEEVWVEVQPRKKVVLQFDDFYGFIHVMRRN